MDEGSSPTATRRPVTWLHNFTFTLTLHRMRALFSA